MEVGVIGTGVMGKPMAFNLLKGDNIVTVYARHPEKVRDLEESGAELVGSPAEVAARSSLILLSLPLDRDVEDTVMGTEGILLKVKAGSVIVDTTTGTAQSAKRVATAAEEKGVGYLDAPISGGVKGATEGTLTFMVGGKPQHLEKVRSVLETLGKNLFFVGPVGAGRTLKAINQMIVGVNTAVLCEAVVLGEMAGISPKTLLEILGKCAANSYQIQTKLPQFIIPGKFDGGFRIELMLKDLHIGLDAAKELGVAMMLPGIVTQVYRAAASAGYAQKDISSLVKFLGSFVATDS